MEIIGYLLLALAVVCFIIVFAGSWWESSPRRFWLTGLTYEDKDQQGFYRFFWVAAWGVAIIGSWLVTHDNPRFEYEGWIAIANTALLTFIAWLLAKIVIGICILIWWLYRWIFKGKPLFSNE